VALDTGKVMPLGATEELRYACRIVAATNRAASPVALRALAQDGGVRADLLARLRRRYFIPSLPERPMDIVPILIDTIRRERLKAKTCYLRMSRPAFEALITYSYPENIRDLQGLASDLPNELVGSFAGEFVPGTPSWVGPAIKESAILLRHLGRLNVSPLGTEGNETWQGAHRITCDAENEFYQFHIAADDQRRRSAPRRGARRTTQPLPPDLPRFFRDFCEVFTNMQADLTDMRGVARAKWQNSPGNSVESEWLVGLIMDGSFSSALTTLYHHLALVHLRLYLLKRESKGLAGPLLRNWLSQDEWGPLAKLMPLHEFPDPQQPDDCFKRLNWKHKGNGPAPQPELLPEIWKQVQKRVDIQDLITQWQGGNRRGAGQKPHPGGDTVLRVLYGRWISKKK